MAHWCETCGQRMPAGEAPDDATWLGAPGEEHQHSFAKPAGAKKTGRDKKLLAVVGAALAIWGLFVGLGRVVTPDNSIDEQAAAEIEEARLEEAAEAADRAVEERVAELEAEREEAREEARIAEVEGDYGAADAAPGFPDADTADPDAPIDDGRGAPVIDASNLGARPGSSVQVDRLQRQLTRRSSSAMLAYRADTGIVVVDLVAGEAQVAALSGRIEQVTAGAHLLRSDAATYAVDGESLVVSQIGEDASMVLSDAADGNVYFVEARSLIGQAPIVEVVSNGEYNFHRAPAGGFQLQPVDGLGLLAVPQAPTGQSLIAGVDSFTELSANRVLTGNEQAILEQVCATRTDCSLAITSLESGESIGVPSTFVRFGDQYALSPDGGSLLRFSPEGFAEVFVAAGTHGSTNDSTAWVAGVGMQAPAWGPNSDFIIWLDMIGDPTLKLMFVDERDWLSIDLRDLGAPVPADTQVVAFARSE